MTVDIVSNEFNKVRSLISELKGRIYHTSELLEDEPNPIDTIEDNQIITGLGVTRLVKGRELIDYTNENYLDPEDPPISFYNDVDPNADYIWIKILDIINSYQGKGYGRDYVNWVKKQYPNHRIYVYPIKTVGFWYKQGFKNIGEDTEWIRYN